MGVLPEFVIAGLISHRPKSRRRLPHRFSAWSELSREICPRQDGPSQRGPPRSKSHARLAGNGIRETPMGIWTRIRELARGIRMANRETNRGIPREILDYKPPNRIWPATPIPVSRMRHSDAQHWPSDRRAPVIIYPRTRYIDHPHLSLYRRKFKYREIGDCNEFGRILSLARNSKYLVRC